MTIKIEAANRLRVTAAPVGKDWIVQYSYRGPSGSGIASSQLTVRSAHDAAQARSIALEQLDDSEKEGIRITKVTQKVKK